MGAQEVASAELRSVLQFTSMCSEPSATLSLGRLREHSCDNG